MEYEVRCSEIRRENEKPSIRLWDAPPFGKGEASFLDSVNKSEEWKEISETMSGV